MKSRLFNGASLDVAQIAIVSSAPPGTYLCVRVFDVRSTVLVLLLLCGPRIASSSSRPHHPSVHPLSAVIRQQETQSLHVLDAIREIHETMAWLHYYAHPRHVWIQPSEETHTRESQPLQTSSPPPQLSH